MEWGNAGSVLGFMVGKCKAKTVWSICRLSFVIFSFCFFYFYFYLKNDDFVQEYICRTVYFIIKLCRMSRIKGFNFPKGYIFYIFFFYIFTSRRICSKMILFMNIYTQISIIIIRQTNDCKSLKVWAFSWRSQLTRQIFFFFFF